MMKNYEMMFQILKQPLLQGKPPCQPGNDHIDITQIDKASLVDYSEKYHVQYVYWVI